MEDSWAAHRVEGRAAAGAWGGGGERTLTGGNGGGTTLQEGEMLLLETEGKDAEQANITYVHSFSLSKEGGLAQEIFIQQQSTELNEEEQDYKVE